MVTGCIRQVLLYSNHYMGIGLGIPNIGLLDKWLYDQV